MRGYAARVGACLVALWIAVGTLDAQGPVTYIYDELGRLVGVIDGSGASAVYKYDAVGNLLAIERYSSGSVTIIEVTPNSGPVGSTVTIRGTGFSTTPGQNTVTFNGTAATVTSATATQLVTTVPSGATSGTIAVTTPSGSATSAAAFTVLAAPTVTSVSPTIGTAGTSVTLTGTNFQVSAALNVVRFHATKSHVVSVSPTSLSTTVPTGATSGPLTVTTPNGQATGGDFYVPPSPYGASDVVFTGRATLGTSFTATVGTASKIGLVLFDGVQNQRISLFVSSSTIPNWKTLTILKPDGTTLVTRTFTGTTQFIDVQTLPATGTYTVLVDPDASNTGNIAFTVYSVPADITGTIVASGSSVGVTLGTPGQNARLTFSGTTGDRVSVLASSVSVANWKALTILKPDGALLTTALFTGSTRFINPLTLPATGTYTLVLDPGAHDTGSATLNLYAVTDVTGSITAGGSGVPVTLNTPGQNAVLTFSGTSGQRVSLAASSVTISNWNLLSILKPDGTTLTSVWAIGSSGFINVQTLPTTGTYSIVLDPELQDTGSATLTLYDVPADVSGSVSVGGSSLGVTIGTPGQNAAITFSGTSSQQITVRVTGSTIDDVPVRLMKPDGTELTWAWGGTGSFNLPSQTLPATGTYTIVVDPTGSRTGSLSVSVTTP